MANQKKRTAWSVQDVVNGRASSSQGAGPKFKSEYSGPKKSSSKVMEKYQEDIMRRTGAMPVEEVNGRSRSAQTGGRGKSSGYGMSGVDGTSRVTGVGTAGRNTGYIPNVQGNSYLAMGSGILDYAWIVYSAVLGLCLMIAVIAYSVNGNKVSGYTYPSYIFTFNGVLNQIYDDYADGGLGSRHRIDQMNHEEEDVDKTSLLGETQNTSTLPNTTTGATMALDTGGTYENYESATSHSQLVEQVQKALEANDFGFIGMKFAYQDENTGDLIGYPQSVVEHFTYYMSENTGKREVFLTEIANEE